MQRVFFIARAIFLDLTAPCLELLVPGARVVALFALGTGQSNNVSWHDFVLFRIKQAQGRNNSCPSPDKD